MNGYWSPAEDSRPRSLELLVLPSLLQTPDDARTFARDSAALAKAMAKRGENRWATTLNELAAVLVHHANALEVAFDAEAAAFGAELAVLDDDAN